MKDSEKNRCTLEEITLNHTNRQYVVLPEIIFQTDDIVLVGAGSFSCVRALYKTAVKQRALGRFLYRVITPEQYAMGQAEEIIRDLIDEALKRTNAGGIIYYASCMDVVSRIDFQKIKKKLCNPDQIPVEVLYRGPMVRRYLDSNKKLTELLMQIPVSKESLRNRGCDLPPVMPDFEAVCGVLQSWKVYRFLISSGGCDGCISGTGERDQEYRVTKSRVDDLQIAVGCEPFIENGIIWDYQNKGCKDLVCIAGAGLPKLIGFDYGRIEKRMKKEKIDCIMMKTDGFHFAQQGIGDMYLSLFQKFEHIESKKNCAIGILGAHCFASLQKDEVEESISSMKKLGYEVIWPEKNELEQIVNLKNAVCNWVTASEGIPIAKYLYRKYNVPYMIGIPSGKKMLSEWQKYFKETRWEEVQIAKSRQSKKKKVLLIGDPAVTWGIARYLTETDSVEIIFAVYTQLASSRRWYTETLQGTEEHWLGGENPVKKIKYFRDREELKFLIDKADIIFGENLLRMAFMEEAICRKKWTDLPAPILNCGIRTDKYEYHLFGTKGARWIHAGTEKSL